MARPGLQFSHEIYFVYCVNSKIAFRLLDQYQEEWARFHRQHYIFKKAQACCAKIILSGNTGRKVPESSTTIANYQRIIRYYIIEQIVPESSYTPVFFASRSYTDEYEENDVAGVSNGVELDWTLDRSEELSATDCCGLESA